MTYSPTLLNDETVEWWNGEAWDLVPTLHLSPHEFYRTRALPRIQPDHKKEQ